MADQIRTGQKRIVMIDGEGAGGICHYTYNLCQSLAEKDMDIILITTPDYELDHLARDFKLKKIIKEGPFKNVEQANHIIAFFQRNWNRITFIIRSLRIIYVALFSNTNIVHVQWLRDPRLDYYVLKFIRLFGKKIVYTAHNILPHNSSPADKESFSRIYKLADRIIVHGEKVKQYFEESYPEYGDRAISIPHGNYLFFVPKEPLSSKVARERLGIAAKEKVILFFGMIRPYKGLDSLIEALPEVIKQVRNTKLLIAGKLGEDFSRYKELIEKLELKDFVISRLEYIPKDKVPDYFVSCDVVAVPYTDTYQSGIVQLAYAFGKSVVVTNVGALAEVVEDGKSGYLIPPRNVEALSKALVSILKNDSLREEMGAYGKHLALTEYSWDTIAERTIELYRKILQQQ